MSVQSPLGREAEKDPMWIASISGKLDAIAHLKHSAKETKESEQGKVKQVSQCLYLIPRQC
jgi:hypothetical protein